jgi:uncharacterized protein YndB with AHSA1/START domain
MNATTQDATSTADREMTATRLLDAPRELVWEAWTDPRHVAQWWGPNGFTNTIQEMDVRPGGVWRLVMHGPDGTDYKNKIIFLEVVKPELLVYKHAGDEGTEPVNFHVTVTFAKEGDKTRLTMRALFPSAAAREHVIKKYGADEGMKQNLARLEQYVTKAHGDRAFVITRVFDAPRELVFQAFTESERLAQWWGPKGFAMLVSRLDLRPGGVFHYQMRSPDGRAMWGKFVYREIVAPERIVFVNSFADQEGNPVRHPLSPTWPLEVLSTLTLAEQDGKTTLTLSGFPINATEVERKTFEDGRSSMQQGFSGTWDQLDAYLAKAVSR